MIIVVRSWLAVELVGSVKSALTGGSLNQAPQPEHRRYTTEGIYRGPDGTNFMTLGTKRHSREGPERADGKKHKMEIDLLHENDGTFSHLKDLL